MHSNLNCLGFFAVCYRIDYKKIVSAIVLMLFV